MKLKDKLTAKLTSWFGRAREKYNEELDNPDSKVSIVKRKLAALNEDLTTKNISEKTESALVSMGIDEPLQETEFGMSNPYRTGLDQYLIVEEEKLKKQREAE